MSKDAYAWAGLAVAIAEIDNHVRQSRQVSPFESRVEDAGILAALFAAVRDSRVVLRRSYSELPTVGKRVRLLDGLRVTGGAVGFSSPPNPESYPIARDEFIFAVISSLIFGNIFPDENVSGDWLQKTINQVVSDGHQELTNQGLINDPILETALGFAILGMIPFSITKQTEKGRVVHQKIRAALWQYERTIGPRGRADTDMRFEVARIARVLKAGAVSAFHEATKSDDD